MKKEVVVEEMQEAEGYKKCKTHKEKCLTDCWIPFIKNNSLISDID